MSKNMQKFKKKLEENYPKGTLLDQNDMFKVLKSMALNHDDEESLYNELMDTYTSVVKHKNNSGNLTILVE